MIYTQADWVPSIAYSSGRSGIAIRAFVIHSAVGHGRPARFFPLRNEASSHFWIAQDGRVEQYVDTFNSAWANGELNRVSGPDPRVPWLRDVYREIGGIGGPNRATISTELEGGGEGNYSEPLTDPQFESLVELTRWVLEEHNLGPPIRHINLLEHNQISATACPLNRVPWARLIARLEGGGLLSQEADSIRRELKAANDAQNMILVELGRQIAIVRVALDFHSKILIALKDRLDNIE